MYDKVDTSTQKAEEGRRRAEERAEALAGKMTLLERALQRERKEVHRLKVTVADLREAGACAAGTDANAPGGKIATSKIQEKENENENENEMENEKQEKEKENENENENENEKEAAAKLSKERVRQALQRKASQMKQQLWELLQWQLQGQDHWDRQDQIGGDNLSDSNGGDLKQVLVQWLDEVMLSEEEHENNGNSGNSGNSENGTKHSQQLREKLRVCMHTRMHIQCTQKEDQLMQQVVAAKLELAQLKASIDSAKNELAAEQRGRKALQVSYETQLLFE